MKVSVIAIFSCALFMVSSALPHGFNNFRSYRGGYGFGDIGGTYSNFPGFGGAYGAFPQYAAVHHPHSQVHYHQQIRPYSYRGAGFLDNLLSGSTLPSMALGFLVGKSF